MNCILVVVLCALFAISQAIRLETLAQTLAELRVEDVFDDGKDDYSFDVVMAVSLVRSRDVTYADIPCISRKAYWYRYRTYSSLFSPR